MQSRSALFVFCSIAVFLVSALRTMAANSSAENEVAASVASGETTAVAETSFLSDIMSTVQNIGLLIAGVALLMGVVSSLAGWLRLFPDTACHLFAEFVLPAEQHLVSSRSIGDAKTSP